MLLKCLRGGTGMFPRMSVNSKHRSVRWGTSLLMPRVDELDVFNSYSILNRLTGEPGFRSIEIIEIHLAYRSKTQAGLLDIATLLNHARANAKTSPQTPTNQIKPKARPQSQAKNPEYATWRPVLNATNGLVSIAMVFVLSLKACCIITH